MENNQSGDKVEILTNQDYFDKIIEVLQAINWWQEENNRVLLKIETELWKMKIK